MHTLLARWPCWSVRANAAHSWPESYADTVLTVRTESTVWATPLRLMAPQLVARLNEQLGDGTVTRVKVLGPDAPSWKKGPRSVRDGRGPRDTYGCRRDPLDPPAARTSTHGSRATTGPSPIGCRGADRPSDPGASTPARVWWRLLPLILPIYLLGWLAALSWPSGSR